MWEKKAKISIILYDYLQVSHTNIFGFALLKLLTAAWLSIERLQIIRLISFVQEKAR